MRQTKLRLSAEDRLAVDAIRSKGEHHSREVNRAHILASLDQDLAEAQILAVLGVGRTALWRTRAAYLEGGLALAVFDEARPGRPVKYQTDAQARITAIACSAPPEGQQRWTLDQLERAARKEPDLATIGRETVRRILKKTTSSPGAG
jgi:Homeodomain-like domain